MLVEIKWATRRDLCYTAANARDTDRQEIIASGPRNMTECGWMTWEAMDAYGGIGWCVWVDDNPEFAFGFTPMHILQPHLFSAWAWGSNKKHLCMAEISRWARGRPGQASLIDRLDTLGAKRIEARSIWFHHEAHRWLEWLGFRKECDLPEWGVGLQRFVQYRWLRSEFAGFGKHGNVTFRGNDHVHGRTRTSANAAAAIHRPAGRHKPRP